MPLQVGPSREASQNNLEERAAALDFEPEEGFHHTPPPPGKKTPDKDTQEPKGGQ